MQNTTVGDRAMKAASRTDEALEIPYSYGDGAGHRQVMQNEFMYDFELSAMGQTDRKTRLKAQMSSLQQDVFRVRNITTLLRRVEEKRLRQEATTKSLTEAKSQVFMATFLNKRQVCKSKSHPLQGRLRDFDSTISDYTTNLHHTETFRHLSYMNDVMIYQKRNFCTLNYHAGWK
ncbi:hypothetical protein Tco_0884394 [Tanacetum coccineum]